MRRLKKGVNKDGGEMGEKIGREKKGKRRETELDEGARIRGDVRVRKDKGRGEEGVGVVGGGEK